MLISDQTYMNVNQFI